MLHSDSFFFWFMENGKLWKWSAVWQIFVGILKHNCFNAQQNLLHINFAAINSCRAAIASLAEMRYLQLLKMCIPCQSNGKKHICGILLHSYLRLHLIIMSISWHTKNGLAKLELIERTKLPNGEYELFFVFTWNVSIIMLHCH